MIYVTSLFNIKKLNLILCKYFKIYRTTMLFMTLSGTHQFVNGNMSLASTYVQKLVYSNPMEKT